ncbi:unnamed protein product, partial [marine sediment metagenome]
LNSFFEEGVVYYGGEGGGSEGCYVGVGVSSILDQSFSNQKNTSKVRK